MRRLKRRVNCMDGIYYHPAGHLHHFRDVEEKNGKADLKDDDGNIVYAEVSVSSEPKTGFVTITSTKPIKKK